MFLGEGLNFGGLTVGISLVIIIWAARFACIKGEYYFTKKLWYVFAAVGIISIGAALFTASLIASSILSIFGFTFLWGIHEIIEQEERVKKGWFPSRKKKGDNGGS